MDNSSGAMPTLKSPTKVAPRRVASSREHQNLWADGPVLHASGRYQGRQVIVEVWEDGRTLSVMTGASLADVGVPSGLVPTALAALQNNASVRPARVAVSDAPMTGSHPSGAAYVGRVIVEFWTAGPVVGLFGSNEGSLLDHAIRHLTSLNRTRGKY